MNPHKLIIRLSLCSTIAALSAYVALAQQQRRPPANGRLAVVVDERLAALRRTPDLSGRLVRRLGRGRMVAISASRTTQGVVFFLVNVTSRTRGWIQREAVVSATRADDDRRLLDLIKDSQGFDQIARARIFLDNFPRSSLRPQVLLVLSNAAENQAARLSRDAAQRLRKTSGDAPEVTYFMNYSGLDRYNRQRVGFVFHRTTKRFHYDGAAWRELVRRYPDTPEAAEARQRLADLAQLKD
ncbi:MAG TPA: hypothetical protein VGJ37_13370 [Pyrinomonadaceae bacterium]|jgi:hypothetical protein